MTAYIRSVDATGWDLTAAEPAAVDERRVNSSPASS